MVIILVLGFGGNFEGAAFSCLFAVAFLLELANVSQTIELQGQRVSWGF
jgi:hypothetical protein